MQFRHNQAFVNPFSSESEPGGGWYKTEGMGYFDLFKLKLLGVEVFGVCFSHDFVQITILSQWVSLSWNRA